MAEAKEILARHEFTLDGSWTSVGVSWNSLPKEHKRTFYKKADLILDLKAKCERCEWREQASIKDRVTYWDEREANETEDCPDCKGTGEVHLFPQYQERK